MGAERRGKKPSLYFPRNAKGDETILDVCRKEKEKRKRAWNSL